MFSDKTPDWVGTWNVYNPSYGYFELFIDKQEDGITKGRIEDCFGTATFSGKITPHYVDFVKRYVHCTEGSYKSDITYFASRRCESDMHLGVYECDEGSGNFFMEKAGRKSSPLEMALAWFDLKEEEEKRNNDMEPEIPF
jgi:hypothetical protein